MREDGLGKHFVHVLVARPVLEARTEIVDRRRDPRFVLRRVATELVWNHRFSSDNSMARAIRPEVIERQMLVLW